MENKIDDKTVQPATAELGAVQINEASLRFTAAHWAWLRGERAFAPTAQEFGLTDPYAGSLVGQIMLTDEYRAMHRK